MSTHYIITTLFSKLSNGNKSKSLHYLCLSFVWLWLLINCIFAVVCPLFVVVLSLCYNYYTLYNYFLFLFIKCSYINVCIIIVWNSAESFHVSANLLFTEESEIIKILGVTILLYFLSVSFLYKVKFNPQRTWNVTRYYFL